MIRTLRVSPKEFHGRVVSKFNFEWRQKSIEGFYEILGSGISCFDGGFFDGADTFTESGVSMTGVEPPF
jgi:hypothetical protein